MFFAAKDGEALYNQQIMNFLLPNKDLNLRKQGNPLDHSGMTYKSNPLQLYSGSDNEI